MILYVFWFILTIGDHSYKNPDKHSTLVRNLITEKMYILLNFIFYPFKKQKISFKIK